MAMLLDKWTWGTTAKFKFRQYFFYGRFRAKLPNLKISNISGYTVYNIYRVHGTNSMKWRVLWALIWHACVYMQNVEPSHAPSAEATYHPSNSAKNRYANIIACKKLYVVCGSCPPLGILFLSRLSLIKTALYKYLYLRNFSDCKTWITESFIICTIDHFMTILNKGKAGSCWELNPGFDSHWLLACVQF